MNRRLCLLVWIGAWLIGPAFAETAAVEGRVVLEPMPQPPVSAMYRTRTRAPILEPDPPRAVVYLERSDGVYPPHPAREVVVVSQRGYQFRPAVAAVPLGGQVSFPNRDDEFHNVFSYSPAKRFDLGRYRKDEESPLVTFDEPGVVRVYCEIHKHMRNLLLVLETPWYTGTDTDGRYRLEGVPPGSYTLRAFLPSERTLSVPVTLRAGETLTVDLGEP
ncbi:MAG TPA: carboxypeptidase regulatory-like domain-containing protein [Pseudomonadales bacterium]